MKSNKAIMQGLSALFSLFLSFSFVACSFEGEQSSKQQQPIISTSTETSTSSVSQFFTTVETEPQEERAKSMKLTVGDKSFTATLAENATAEKFVELMKTAPVVIEMSDYSGFEKVGSLGTSLPTDNSNISVNEGVIVLYNGNQIVVFYGSHSWSYTRLGKIDDLSGLKEALGSGDVTIAFSVE